jgi:hypothetical protein
MELIIRIHFYNNAVSLSIFSEYSLRINRNNL